MTSRILDLFFGRALSRRTSRYLEELASAPTRASRDEAAKVLKAVAGAGGPAITLGTTSWCQSAILPIAEVLRSHALVTGGSGAGKTRAASLVIQALFAQLPYDQSFGFGLIDPKRELFDSAVFLLSERLAHLERIDPEAAVVLRQRVTIIDFSSDDPLSPYNIICCPPDVDTEFFADSRADQLINLLPARDNLSVNGNSLLRRMILLLSELNSSITLLPRLLTDEDLRGRLFRKCTNRDLRMDCERQIASTPKTTVSALCRRIEALFSSRSVHLALNASSAPDFRALQDDGKIVLVNCFGANLSKSVRQLLQAIVVGDIGHAVFARRRTEQRFLWLLDEAQNCFVTERLRDQMGDLFTMARSFGSFFLCLTQNISTAVPDSRLLSQIHTNLKWSFSMRGHPADCAFLKSAMPITGRKLRPQVNPFEPPGFYTIAEERAMELDAIASLPNRVGYLWMRSLSREAVQLKTQSIDIPDGELLENATKALLSDPALGGRLSRQVYEAEIKQRRDCLQDSAQADLSDALASAYKRSRGADA